MGNATSAEGGGDMDASLSKQEEGPLPDENLLDFSVLFQSEGLHKALLGVKEPTGGMVSAHKEPLIKWLKGLVDREETTVNIVQLMDFLTNKGASKEEVLEFFSEVDREGEGVADITVMLMLLKETPADPVQALIPCHTLPGPVDVYVDDKSALAGAGKKLVQFLQAHRVQSEQLKIPCMQHIHSTLTLREKLVNGRFHTQSEREKEEELLGGGTEKEEGRERMIIAKCHSKINVSSNARTMDHLTDGRMDTYWQSNGSPRSHWIRISMIPGVLLKELAIGVDSSDDSYMAKNISVLVGNSESNLKELKSVVVPRETTGRYVLVRNLGTEYRFVQLNIRGCHSDGCDTRIRGLFVKGCKFAKEPQPTVLDTMVIWYLGILASTARAAMPVAPQLRETILTQSKLALQSLPALSLSPTSPARPEFLTSFVIAEMDKFLTTLCLPAETFVSVDADSLQVLLGFALAHGGVNPIMDCLHILLDNLALELPLGPLLHSLEEIRREKRQRHAECLKLALVSCDGGQKDESHRPDCMLTNDTDSSSNPYVSEEGKKVVNVLLREEEGRLLEVGRVVVKVQGGSQGAKAGLLFVFNTEDPSADDLLDPFSKFDNCTIDDFLKLQQERQEGGGAVDEWTPIAYFEPDKETSEVDLVPDIYKTGKYLLLKFLGPRGEEAERVGVHSVKFYGHSSTVEETASTAFLTRMDSVVPLPPEKGGSLVGGALLLTRVLSFLAAMLQDLAALRARRRAASLDPVLISEPHLTVEELSLEKIWSLYIPLTLNPDPQLEFASLLCLHMLRAALPFTQPSRPSLHKGPSEPLAVPSAILAHLSGMLDSKDTPVSLRRLAQEIVVEGVVVFFPDATARRDYLLSMIDSVLEDNQPQSWWQKFEALCRHFSKTDSNSLLGLPKKAEEGVPVDTAPALNILNRMLVVAAREAVSCMGSGTSRPGDLVGLLSALQASLFFWCRRHITALTGEARKTVAGLIVEYAEKLVTHCVPVLKQLEALEAPSEPVLKALERTLLARTLPEMIVFLSTFTGVEIDKVKLLNSVYPLVSVLNSITSKFPDMFLKVDSDALKASDGTEATLGLWTRESNHNYENNARIHEDFVCPGATKFVLEFDSRCCTERRYDYLQFTDVLGEKKQFDDKVGSDRWPKTAEIPGPKLHFYFHSDGSTNEWGYKFTLKALGRPTPQLAPLFDLQVSLARLLGLICSTVLSTKSICTQYAEGQSEEQREEEQLVHSDLWKTVFRGGYMVSKFTRSLSGAYSASPADSALSSLLQDLASGAEGSDSAARPLLELCRTSYKGHYYGGPQVDRAVNAVFASLIWHSQEIREELMSHASMRGGPSTLKVTPGLLKAFGAAEAMRRELVEARQKLLESKEKEEDGEKKESINEDAPVLACHKKAMFLLKFAGLSRVHKDKNKRGKLTHAVSTVSRLKQHLQGPSEKEEVSEKYPSFELVLNFVKNDAMSMEKVQSLIQQRSTLASHVAQVYTFIAEYIRIIGTPRVFELPGLVFLQQLLAKQRHFPAHYASKLDGCGLELENQVRKSYRMMMLRLLETVNHYKKPLSKEHSLAALVVSTCLVHLLDLEWQDYDHTLLAELQLPEFLLHSAIKSSSCEERVVIEKFDQEDAMMERYRLHMQFLEKFHEMINEGEISLDELQELPLVQENRKEAGLFAGAISHFSKGKLKVQCDGCSSIITSRWYHNLDLDDDFDLCSTCFTNGSGTRPSSHSTEQLYLYMGGYNCDHCHMSIITHRFHSTTRKDFDLCLGCFRKEEADGGTDTWTVHLLAEQPSTATSNKFCSSETEHSVGMPYKDGMLTKVGPAVELMVYNQHHCWILFSSLCLTMAATLNTSIAGGEYMLQASSMLLECLKLLAFELRAAILAKWEDESKKKAMPPLPSSAGQEPATHPEGELARSRVVVDEAPSDKEQASPTGEQQEEAAPPTGGQQEETAPPTGGQQEEATPPTGGQQEEATPPTGGQQEEATPPTGGQQEETAPPTGGQQTAAAPPTGEQPEETAPPPDKQEEQVTPDSTGQLEQAPSAPSEEDPLAQASKQASPEDGLIGNQEKAFAMLWMDKMMGLLVAVLPKELSLSRWSNYRAENEAFLAEKLLPTLLHFSGCTAMPSSPRLMALLVAAQYMARISPQVADKAVDIAVGNTPEVGEVPGLKTLRIFFSSGAAFLKKSEFTGTAAAAECLLQLAKAELWQPAFMHTISQTLQTAPQEMDLASIFGLLVIAGFPKLPREGCVLSRPTDEGPVRGVLTSLSADRQQGVVVDLQSRTPHQQERLSRYGVEDTLHGCIDASRLPALLSLLKTALQLYRQESDSQVEATWVLALGLKSLHVILQSQGSDTVVRTLLDAGLVPPIVKLASRPTRLSQKWHLADLEVLGIHSYQPPSLRKTAPREAGEGQQGAGTQEEGAKEGEKASPSSPLPDDAVLEGLSDEIQDMLKIMKEAFQCSLAVLRAMYEAAGDDMNQFIMSSEQYYDVEEGVLKPPDSIVNAAKKWEPENTSVRSAVQEIQDSLEDMGVTRLTPLDSDVKTLEAVQEGSSIFKKNKNLMKEEPTPQDDPSREESSKLLQEELAKLREKAPDRAEVLKVQQAVVVLQARQVLATLLTSWPSSGPRLSTTFLGGLDPTQYLCLLDLLSHHQPKEQCKKVFSTVLQRGESTEVVSLAVTAAQCMGEVCVGSEQRQLHPPAKGADPTTETGKIVIANASSVAVKFHPVKGEILLSSSESLSEHKKSHSATCTNPQDQHRHIVPGNTVHYKVILQPGSEDKSPACMLKFTGTQVGRFETGHSLLKLLLCQELQFAKSLPLERLWPCLIAAACQHSGERRLKVITLIRAVLSQQGACPATDSDSGGKLELSALKPLWQLYTTMMKEYDEKCKKNQLLAPEIIRVLTELFFTVENLAQELDVSQDLLVDMLTHEGLHTWLEKGISNVAFLSLGLGLDNFASNTFIEAKVKKLWRDLLSGFPLGLTVGLADRNYAPPKPEEKMVEEDGGSEDEHKSSSSSDDSSDDDDDDDDSYDDSSDY